MWTVSILANNKGRVKTSDRGEEVPQLPNEA